MVTSSTLRGPAQGGRIMRKMPQSAVSREPKPVFAVLETAAVENEAAAAMSDKKEPAKSTNLSPKLRLASPLDSLQNSAAISNYTPQKDSALSNCVNVANPHVINTLRLTNNTFVPYAEVAPCTTVATVRETAPGPRGESYAVRVQRALFYKYQRVTNRKIVPFQPAPEKAPGYLLAYVVETLECGHKVVIHPIDGEHLTARRRCCHECSGLFGGLPIDPLKKPAEKIRRAKREKKQAGHSWWWPVGIGFAASALIAFLLWKYQPKTYIYVAPVDVWRVLSDVNPDSEVIMQRVHEGTPLPPWTMRFCSDYKPRFEIGMTLTWFAYEDRGECVSVARKDLGYVIDRGPDTWPKLARNCAYHVNPSVAWGKSSGCDGRPQFD